MKNPISIFILDVSNSSNDEMGIELSHYLDQLVIWISEWTDGIGPIKIKHRAGDEIIFIGYGYSTAFIIAYYVNWIWKFKQHKPYFGLSFGDIERELEEIDIEKWIHPLIKQARYANDLIKQESRRTPFKFELDQFYIHDPLQESFTFHHYRFEFEQLLNSLLTAQQWLIKEQTDIQEQVYRYYLILQQKKTVAALLGKTASTISSHFKKGKSEEIHQIFQEIHRTLYSLQKKMHQDDQENLESKELMNSIQNYLKNHYGKIIS
ncbi:hypothetical protein [Neobacillus sp. LXY-1]|uniref:hypothetical protein n=1 Tax=Neobacillus sp. LXY-1 TaxID=3379133 RepID=UPI003EDF5A9D